MTCSTVTSAPARRASWAALSRALAWRSVRSTGTRILRYMANPPVGAGAGADGPGRHGYHGRARVSRRGPTDEPPHPPQRALGTARADGVLVGGEPARLLRARGVVGGGGLPPATGGRRAGGARRMGAARRSARPVQAAAQRHGRGRAARDVPPAPPRRPPRLGGGEAGSLTVFRFPGRPLLEQPLRGVRVPGVAD